MNYSNLYIPSYLYSESLLANSRLVSLSKLSKYLSVVLMSVGTSVSLINFVLVPDLFSTVEKVCPAI